MTGRVDNLTWAILFYAKFAEKKLTLRRLDDIISAGDAENGGIHP